MDRAKFGPPEFWGWQRLEQTPTGLHYPIWSQIRTHVMSWQQDYVSRLFFVIYWREFCFFLRNQVFANAFWSGDRRSIVSKERTEGRIIWIITTRRPRSLNHTSHQTIAYLHRLGLIVVPISTCWPSWVVRIHKRLQLVRKMLLSKLQAIVAAMINQTNAYLIAIRMFLDTIVNQSTSHRRLC